LVLVLSIIAALFAAGSVALYLQLSSTRNAGLIRSVRAALYCAESGLVAARPVVGGNYAMWATWLQGTATTTPAVYPIVGDIDGDGTNDFEVTIRDNDDEQSPLTNDTTVDNDLQVFVVSKCTKYAETPREVLELIVYQGAGMNYRDQSGGGSGNTGNQN
jgi:hypothetical protein